MAINSEIVFYVDKTQHKAGTIRKGSRCRREPVEHSPHPVSLGNNII